MIKDKFRGKSSRLKQIKRKWEKGKQNKWMKGRAKHKRCLKLLPQMRYVMCSVFHGSVEEIILNLHWTPFNVVSVSHLQCLSILVSSYGGLCNSIGWCCLCGSGIGLIGCLELPTESSSQSPQARKPHEPDLG